MIKCVNANLGAASRPCKSVVGSFDVHSLTTGPISNTFPRTSSPFSELVYNAGSVLHSAQSLASDKARETCANVWRHAFAMPARCFRQTMLFLCRLSRHIYCGKTHSDGTGDKANSLHDETRSISADRYIIRIDEECIVILECSLHENASGVYIVNNLTLISLQRLRSNGLFWNKSQTIHSSWNCQKHTYHITDSFIYLPTNIIYFSLKKLFSLSIFRQT